MTRKRTNPDGTATGGPACPAGVLKTASRRCGAAPRSGTGPAGPNSGVVLTSVS